MAEEVKGDVISRMQAGDPEAFRQLLRHHLGPVSAYVARMISNKADTEDIVQETFLRLWRHRSVYDPDKAALSTWLHRVAYNLCMDHFRKNREKTADGDLQEPETQSGPAQLYDAEQLSDQVNDALMRLDERQRSALILCHYQGLSNRQAAMILEVSVEALESILRRGRTKLRKALETPDKKLP